MGPTCDHHDHEAMGHGAPDFVWRCRDRNGTDMGAFCTTHLGDALDDFDGDVHLTREPEGR